MKKTLLSIAFLLAFTGVAMADSTTASATTTLTVNVVTPVTLTCPETLSYNLVAGSTTTPAGKSFSCTTSGGPTPSTGGVSLTYQLDQIPTCATCGAGGTPTTLANVGDVQVSADGGTSYVAASASAPQTLVSAADTISSTYSLKLLLAQEDKALAAGAYTANMTFTLNVDYTP